MNRELTLEEILTAIGIVQNTPIHETPIFIRQPDQGSRTTMGLALEVEEVLYDFKKLSELVLACIADYSIYHFDTTHRTDLLKDTNVPGTMLLDGIRRHLPDYNFLRSMPVSRKEVVFHFKNPLNLNAIAFVIESAGQGHSIRLRHLTKKTGVALGVYYDNVQVLMVENYYVKFPYYTLIESGKLKEGLQSISELVTRIHQDSLFLEGSRLVHFAQYQPVLKLMWPDVFEDRLTDFIREVRQLATTQQITQHPSFKETKNSRLHERANKRYALVRDSVPEHLDYIVACPARNELYVRFSSNLDYDRIREMVENAGLTFVKEVPNVIHEQKIIKKGSGSRLKSWEYKVKHFGVYDREGNRLLTFEGQNNLRLYLGQDSSTFEKSIGILSQIYYGRLFYTGWFRTAEIDSDISPNERGVITLIDTLAGIYHLFLSVEEDRLRVQKDQMVPTPIEWVAETMTRSPIKSPNEMVMCVLNELNRRIKPEDFSRYGSNPDTQKRLTQNYLTLQALLNQFRR